MLAAVTDRSAIGRDLRNTLYYGDNLDVLRRHIASESVDLVYLDPPFNSNASYNILFADQGTASEAQVQAFGDTWRWDLKAVAAYEETVEAGGEVGRAVKAFRTLVGTGDMLAYLSMMAPRLVELHRVLAPQGSLYLHCDPTASHYLKLLLDAVFGPRRFVNEIIWKRQSSHNDSAQGSRHYGRLHDVILFYSKTADRTWHQAYGPYDPEYVAKFYRHVDEASGRHYQLSDITAPGGASPAKGNPHYEFLGVTRYWRFSQERMQRMYEEGRIVQTAPGRVPRQKRYLDEMRGVPVGSVWDDIKPVQVHASERLRYPTQKPVHLLDRIIATSSSQGDVVLDPFCGCGTTIEAAQELGRRWIGIDITHHATGVIKSRLVETYGPGIAATFDVRGEPTTVEDAAILAHSDPYQFQSWALGLVGARLAGQTKKGRDEGIDGRLFFHERNGDASRQVIISVKGGHLAPAHVRELTRVVDREDAEMGLLISLDAPSSTMRAEARDAGSAVSSGTRVDKIQLRTVAQLLSGRSIDFPGGHQVQAAPANTLDRGVPLELFPPEPQSVHGKRRGASPSRRTRPGPPSPGLLDTSHSEALRDAYAADAAQDVTHPIQPRSSKRRVNAQPG